MATLTVRVLVVDDFEPWRRFVTSTFQKLPNLQVICEASDGLEAVQRTQELQPDLILLDIGLPKLSGLEAARRICGLAPKSRILFVSQDSSPDVVEAALRAGGNGYVVKSEAASELLPAVEAVLQGKRFFSPSLAGHDLTDSEDRKKVVAPLPPKKIQTRHEVEFYPDDAALVDGFARTIEAALEVGNPVIVVATELHRASILERLRADAVDVDATIKQGSYVALDALATLPTLMASDLPDPIRCAKVVSDLIMGAAKGAKGKHSRVAICGEIAPTLLAQGNAEGAVRLEHLWDEITRNYAADTLCGYLQSAFPRVESSLICERICAEHSAVHGRQLWY